MKKILHLALILLLAGSASAFNVTLENSADRENLEYDILRNFSGFYNNFPESYDQRDEIGSFSFADQSLENPDYRMDFTDGNYSFLSQRTVQLYYASQTGNTTVPLMDSPLDTGNLSEADSTVDLEISPFRSLYPGEIYMGFTQRKFQVNGSNRSNTTDSDVFNLTKLGTVMEGNYSVSPSIRRLQNSTRLTVNQVKDEDGRLIYSSQKSPELVISVSKNGEVLDEARARPGKGEVLDIAFSGGEEVFVNGFKVLETRGVSECETVSDNDFYYIVNQSNFNTESGENPGCLKVENTTETVVDFANTTIDGQRENGSFTEGCALTVTNSSGVEVKEPRVQQYEKGICVEDSRNTFISGTASKENSLGVVMENSSTSITKISLENNKSEIRAQNSSTVNMTEVNFDTADISLFGEDFKADNVYKRPPDPNGTVNASQWINISSTDNQGYVEDLGFNYPPISELDINPLFMFEFDLKNVQTFNNSTTIREYDRKNLSIIKEPVERVIRKPGEIDDFSIFAIYGERIEGNGTGNTPGEGAGENPDGTGSQGGSPDPGSGASSGGAGGGLTPEPDPEPEPEPIELNLSLEEETARIQQGGTAPINFSLTNMGDVEATNVRTEAEVRSGWESGIEDFESIPEGETDRGSILIDVFQSEVPGNYSIPVAAERDGATLDEENINIQVLPREQIRDIEIVEGPSFLNLEAGSTSEVGFLLQNVGDFDLRNVSLEIRNAEDCIRDVKGSHDFAESEKKSVDYSVSTKGQEKTCTGIFTFSSVESSEMAVRPVRIEITPQTLVGELTSGILPILLVIWSLFTVYWLWRRFYE